MPAVVYGEGITSQPITVPLKDFIKTHKEAGESTLIKLQVTGTEGKKTKEFNVIIHEIANHPLSGTPLHADFYAVRMDRVMRVKVPLEFIGEAPAIKNEGGILVKVLHELEIEALPQDLPHELIADTSFLENIGTRLLVGNIKLPQGVKILAEPDEIIALVEAPRSDAELEALKEAPIQETAEVKTEMEVKKELKAKTDIDTEEKVAKE